MMEKEKQIKQWVIYTDGTNLKHVIGQSINSNRTTSNDVHEIYELLELRLQDRHYIMNLMKHMDLPVV